MLDDRTRRRLAADLDQLIGDLPIGKKLPPEQVAALVRERAGISIVAGVDRFAPESGGVALSADSWRGSATQVYEGRLFRLSDAAPLEWRTAPVPSAPSDVVAFVFSMAIGNGAAYPQPTATFVVEMDGQQVAEFCVTKSARVWGGSSGLFGFWPLRADATAFGHSFDVDDTITRESLFADGYGVVVVPAGRLDGGRTAAIRIRGAAAQLPTRHWCRVSIGQPALYADTHLSAVRNSVAPRARIVLGDKTLLFGDLHTHSGESSLLDDLPDGEGADEPCGVGERAELFKYARDVAGLNFFCLSEHDWQMDERDWKDLRALNDSFHEAGFLTIHGYEWTSATYGHRNVYFGESPGPMLYSQDPRAAQNALLPEVPTPHDLWRSLRESGIPAITVPHHMSSAFFPLDTRAFHDDEFDRVAEIYSTWGDSLEHGQAVTTGAARIPELAFIESVRRGVTSGFIASSDSHDGHPGNAQGTTKRPHLFHHLGSGLAGVFVDDLSRASIFNALRERRCYASTDGATAVWITVNGHPMGAAVRDDSTVRELEITVRAATPLSRISIYRNADVVDHIDVSGRTECQLTWRDTAPDGPRTSYFVKVVRQDFETAWTSPTWLNRT
jgi:hypothetical protein